jgi:hypothetical protein
VLARLFLLACLCLLAAGCSLDGQVVVEFSGTSPSRVTETIKPEQTPYHVAGVTSHNGQRVGITCAITMSFDVKEATGSAVLIQRRATRLRTRSLRRGTRYSFDCLGALVTELPADASDLRGVAESDTGATTALSARTVTSVRIGFGRRLRPAPHTLLAVARWPIDTSAGSYRVSFAFSLPAAHAFTQRVIYTASVSCGRSVYLQPLLPAVTSMKRSPPFTIHPSAQPATVPLPHIDPGITSNVETTKTLACS